MRNLLRGTPDERRNYIPEYYLSKAHKRTLVDLRERYQDSFGEELRKEMIHREQMRTYRIRLKAWKAEQAVRRYSANV